ncbi:MAG: hypothetical protein KH301_00135 [Brachyspira sp.]|nr:hypothetical protein [Brachyspira sp.]
MIKWKKEYYLILVSLIILSSQLYIIMIFEDFACNTKSNSCKVIQTNIFGAKNIIDICKYSDLDSIKYEYRLRTRVSHSSHYMLKAVTKHNEHKLITTKRFYKFQDYSKIINNLNDKIQKQENFSYRFWGLSNKYKHFFR